jgi:hypothetical protein
MTAPPPGVEFHTFTVIGRCARTGRMGIGTAPRSSRVPPLPDWLRDKNR